MGYAQITLPYSRLEQAINSYSQVPVTLPAGLSNTTRMRATDFIRDGVAIVLEPNTSWTGQNIQPQIEYGDFIQDFAVGTLTQLRRVIRCVLVAPDIRSELFTTLRADMGDLTLRFAFDQPPIRMRLGNMPVVGWALGDSEVVGAALGDTLLWEPRTTGSQGYTIPVMGQRAGSSFYEWSGSIPTRFDLGGSLRGILFEQNNSGGRASLWFDRPLRASHAEWFWETTLRPDPSDMTDAYFTEQRFNIQLSTQAVATLGTVTGLYRYYADLTQRSQIGSYIATVNNFIGVANRAVTNSAPFTSWSSTFSWTES